MKATIVYYTNNLIAPKLLENTLKAVIEHARNNDCELIVTSHFPLFKTHETNILDIYNSKYAQKYNPLSSLNEKHEIYNKLVKDIFISDDSSDLSFCKNIVVGKLPYIVESIIKQILLSLYRASTNKIIFMEHDCFYAHNYVDVVEKCLNDFELTTVLYSNELLNYNGFFNIGQKYYLSSIAMRKDIAIKVFERKLSLTSINHTNAVFEPLTRQQIGKGMEIFTKEIVVEKTINIDSILPEGSILDIKHALNQNGYIDASTKPTFSVTIEGIQENIPQYKSTHPYWGDAKKYIDMFDILSDEEKRKYGIGMSPF